MSDRIAVMNAGHVEQMDSSSQVFEYPQTEFVAQFMGASNFFSATVRGIAEGFLSLAMPDGDSFTVRIRVACRGRSGALRRATREARPPQPRPFESRHTLLAGDHRGPGLSGCIDRLGGDERAGERFVIYEQNEKPFEERGKFAVGGTAFSAGVPPHRAHATDA